MACEKETKGKDTFEPMAVEGKLEVTTIILVKMKWKVILIKMMSDCHEQ